MITKLSEIKSAENRDITLYEVSPVNFGKTVLVIGVFHGDELQGEYLIRKFLDSVDSENIKNKILAIPCLNPDGKHYFTRQNANKIDLNRNFGIDFSKPENLPSNPKYAIAHPVLLSKPDKIAKKNAIKQFRQNHLKDGVWAAISNGQYYEPYGLFYGGRESLPENITTMRIYDDIMDSNAKSLISIGLHTGLGRFYRKRAQVTSSLLVSHPLRHTNTGFFRGVLTPSVPVVADNNAINGPTLLGDMVDCLENRYKSRNIPVYTADLEIGTGEFPIMSPVYKRMDMGDARYDLLHYGKINNETWSNLTESWYPSDVRWKNAALRQVEILFDDIIYYMNTISR